MFTFYLAHEVAAVSFTVRQLHKKCLLALLGLIRDKNTCAQVAAKPFVCRPNHRSLWEYTQLPNNGIYEVVPKQKSSVETHFI